MMMMTMMMMLLMMMMMMIVMIIAACRRLFDDFVDVMQATVLQFLLCVIYCSAVMLC